MSISAPSDISGLVLDLDPHAEAYEDAAGTTAATVGGEVGRVSDQTGNGYHATQISTTGKKPTLAETADGWRVAEFNGTEEFMNVPQAMWDNHIVTRNEFWVVAVVVNDDLAVDGAVTGAWTNGGPMLWMDTGGVDGYAAIVDGAGLRAGESVASATSSRQIVAMRFNGSLIAVDVDGAEADSASGSHTTSALSGDWGWGSERGGTIGSRFFNGRQYRLLVYAHHPTSTERSDLNAYLTSLYANPPGGSTPTPSPLLLAHHHAAARRRMMEAF